MGKLARRQNFSEYFNFLLSIMQFLIQSCFIRWMGQSEGNVPHREYCSTTRVRKVLKTSAI
jgi:hypothetical protein